MYRIINNISRTDDILSRISSCNRVCIWNHWFQWRCVFIINDKRARTGSNKIVPAAAHAVPCCCSSLRPRYTTGRLKIADSVDRRRRSTLRVDGGLKYTSHIVWIFSLSSRNAFRRQFCFHRFRCATNNERTRPTTTPNVLHIIVGVLPKIRDNNGFCCCSLFGTKKKDSDGVKCLTKGRPLWWSVFLCERLIR